MIEVRSDGRFSLSEVQGDKLDGCKAGKRTQRLPPPGSSHPSSSLRRLNDVIETSDFLRNVATKSESLMRYTEDLWVGKMWARGGSE